jgi:hypothetical protein
MNRCPISTLLRDGMRGAQGSLPPVDAPVLYVTFDQSEAMSLADEVILLCEGGSSRPRRRTSSIRRRRACSSHTFVGSPRMNVWRARTMDADSTERACARTRRSLPGVSGRSASGPKTSKSAVPSQGAWPAEVLVEPLAAAAAHASHRSLRFRPCRTMEVRGPCGALAGGQAALVSRRRRKRCQPPAVWDSLVAGGLLFQT